MFLSHLIRAAKKFCSLFCRCSTATTVLAGELPLAAKTRRLAGSFNSLGAQFSLGVLQTSLQLHHKPTAFQALSQYNIFSPWLES